MKPLAFLSAIALAAVASAQNQDAGSPAGENSTTRLINQAVTSASSAASSGKKLTLTVDNRSVPYTGRMFGKMLYVPIRFFSEAGLSVTWDGRDTRGTIRDENGPQKRSIDYIAQRSQRNYDTSASMKPIYQKGQLLVPLASTLASFGLVAEWVPTSNRLNVRSNRPASSGG